MLNFPDQEQNKISRLCLATKIVTDCQSKRSVERGRLMGRRLSALYADSILCCFNGNFNGKMDKNRFFGNKIW